MYRKVSEGSRICLKLIFAKLRGVEKFIWQELGLL